MTTETKKGQSKFWLNWSLSSTGIITVSYIASLIAVGIVHGSFGFNFQEWGTPLSNTLMQIAGGAVIGLGTGLYQKSMLQKLFKVSSWWIYTSIIGFVVTEMVIGIILWQMGLIRGQLRFIEFNPLPESLFFASAGFLIGFLQWFILRKSFPRSYFWIIANTIGWWICIFLTYVIGLINEEVSIFAFIPGAFIYGAITGATLLWLLKPKKI